MFTYICCNYKGKKSSACAEGASEATSVGERTECEKASEANTEMHASIGESARPSKPSKSKAFT